MSAQLNLSEDLSPRTFRKFAHIVNPRVRDREMEDTLSFMWDEIAKEPESATKRASVFEMPALIPEPRPAIISGLPAHWCGLGKHYVWCCNVKRCTLPAKSPCAACEEKVAASYRPGRYVSR
jgi:hypothetical protein